MKKNLLLPIMSIFFLFTQLLNATVPTIDSTFIVGCTNPNAKNYNPLAQKDDGSCVFSGPVTPPVIYGCMNPKALNFNPNATKDNGSCVFGDTTITAVIYGCTNPNAKNYNPKATKDNESCIFDTLSVIYGCKDPTALNYNPYAKIGNKNCIYKTFIPGCTDTLAVNYNSTANVNDGSCKYIVNKWGCTDKSALNFSPVATQNNGYCQYDSLILGCTDKNAINFNPMANHDNKTCIFTSAVTLGCTDPFALNFNKFATKDNGSCTYRLVSDTIKGCTDKTALNFNPLATAKIIGKCIYHGTDTLGCKSPRALNYDSLATHDDGSCVFAKPVNIILPVVKPNITAIADTLGKVLAASCNFNYSIPIDSVKILSTTHLPNNVIEVEWAITQGSTVTTIKTDFTVKKHGTILLYLSLVCNQGNAPTTSTSSVKLNTAISNVSSISTDAVKGVTLSAYLSNNVISEVVSPSANNYGISLYPNPVKDQLSITFTNTDNNTIQLVVYSVDGRRLMTSNVSAVSGVNRFEINTSTLKSGLHFLAVNKNGNTLQTIKFAKY